MSEENLPQTTSPKAEAVADPFDPVETESKGWLKRNTSKESRRLISVALATTIIVVALVLILTAIPFPYVIESPGPTFNVLGKVADKPVISLTNKPEGEEQQKQGKLDPGFGFNSHHGGKEGQLRAVTVSISGGPGRMVNLSMLIGAWISGDRILPEEEVYPKNITAQQVEQMSTAQMKSSQFNAEVAALEEMGYHLPATATISGIADWSDAKGKLENGDRLVWISDDTDHRRIDIKTPTDTKKFVEKSKVGDQLTIGFIRKGKEESQVVQVKQNPDTKTPAVGILYSLDVKFPVDIKLQLGDTGGPSAGVMFALGIINRLSAKDITGGQRIAGTGELDVAGNVFEIGGVNQKIKGATRDGAKWFMLPEGNCADLVNPNPNIRLIPIKTLRQARTIVQDIGSGKTANLPTCPAK